MPARRETPPGSTRPLPGGPFPRPEGLGRYTHLREIARGGMGSILRGIDPELGRPVAIKVLSGDGGDPELLERFLLEARITGQLEHPNIVPIHEVGRTAQGHPWFAMKLVHGRSLAETLDAGETALPRLLSIFVKICDAVAFAHSRRIVHRDLKPANVMVGEFGEVLVMDWGLARVLDRDDPDESTIDRPAASSVHTAFGTVVGTPAYMPPEQARGAVRQIDERSDVYALGAILFEILTLEPPFEGEDAESVLAAVRSAHGALAPSARCADVPRELDAVVLRATARRRKDRYARVEDLRSDVEAWLDGRPLATLHYGPLERAFKWAKRHRGTAAAAATGLASVLALAAFLIPGWLAEARARRETERELYERQELELEATRARERARVPLEAGRRVVHEIRLLQREPGHAREDRIRLARLAEAEFEKALAEIPDDPDALVGIAQAWRLAGDAARALAALDRAIAEHPAFATAYLDRVRLRIEAYERLRHGRGGRVAAEDDAARRLRVRIEADLEAAGRHARETWERKFARGLLAFARGDHREAAAALGEYLEAAPTDAEALYHAGHALYHLEDHASARSLLDRAVRCDVRNQRALVNRGLVAKALGDLDGALADFDEAIRLDPDYVSALTNRGLARIDRGDLDGAVRDFDRALTLEPDMLEALAGRGMVLVARGDPASAEADLDRALAIDPDHVAALTFRGSIRQQRDDLAGALDDLDRALSFVPDSCVALWQRGLVRRKGGDVPAARRDLERAREVAPPGWSHRARTEDILRELGRR